MKVLSHKMNFDIYEVIKAASTKPFGFVPFYPGPGFAAASYTCRSISIIMEGKNLIFTSDNVEL